jgi:PAS domain S-box-containing protein
LSKVLVVDDDEAIRSILKKALIKKGYQVFEAANSEECCNILKRENIDLTLLDIMLPGSSGIDILKKARKIAPDTVNITITAYGSLESAIKAIEHGASGYILKPFRIKDLIIAVEKALKEKELEFRLKKSEEKYRDLYDNAPDMYHSLDKNGIIIDCNETEARVLGYKKEEIVGRPITDFFTEESKTLFEKQFPKLNKEKIQLNMEREFVRKDGTIFAASLNIFAEFNEDGKLIRTKTIARDITERKNVEEEIKRLKEFNENIVQSMEEGILIEDAEGIITFVNPRMQQMLGCSQDELIGNHWTEIFLPGYENEVREKNAKLAQGEKVRYGSFLRCGDAEVPVLVSAAPLTEADTYVGNLKVFVDITEHKKMEEKLRQKSLKYNIERGKSYLITEKVLDMGMEVFTDLIQAGYRGIVISRASPEEFVGRIGEGGEVFRLSEMGGGREVVPPQLGLVKKIIKDSISRDSVVLLDRIDYLVVQNSFNDVLMFLHELNDMMQMAKAILLVVVDPDTLARQEFSLLEKDIPQVEDKYMFELDNDLLEVLEFVKRENGAGRKPVHKDVTQAFGITRPTALKRIKRLKSMDLLVNKKRGRFKTLELTEGAKKIL